MPFPSPQHIEPLFLSPELLLWLQPSTLWGDLLILLSFLSHIKSSSIEIAVGLRAGAARLLPQNCRGAEGESKTSSSGLHPGLQTLLCLWSQSLPQSSPRSSSHLISSDSQSIKGPVFLYFLIPDTQGHIPSLLEPRTLVGVMGLPYSPLMIFRPQHELPWNL